MSGLEIMLKSMGLGDVIEQAKILQSNGTLEKILKFADGVEEMNARLIRIEQLLSGVEHSALPGPGPERLSSSEPIEHHGV